MKNSCYNCGYFREFKRPDGSILKYCKDKECAVDPYDPECNYE